MASSWFGLYDFLTDSLDLYDDAAVKKALTGKVDAIIHTRATVLERQKAIQALKPFANDFFDTATVREILPTYNECAARCRQVTFPKPTVVVEPSRNPIDIEALMDKRTPTEEEEHKALYGFLDKIQKEIYGEDDS